MLFERKLQNDSLYLDFTLIKTTPKSTKYVENVELKMLIQHQHRHLAKVRHTTQHSTCCWSLHGSITRSERHCRICSLSEVENEEHFILFCPALSKCRDNFINRIASIKRNFASMSAENRVKFNFFNESLPHSLLELSSEMLVSLLETRRSLINLIENRQLLPRK